MEHAGGETNTASVAEHLGVRRERRKEVERQAAPEQHAGLVPAVPLEATAEDLQGESGRVRVGKKRQSNCARGESGRSANDALWVLSWGEQQRALLTDRAGQGGRPPQAAEARGAEAPYMRCNRSNRSNRCSRCNRGTCDGSG